MNVVAHNFHINSEVLTDITISEDNLNALINWDLSDVKTYMINRYQVDSLVVEELEKEYKRFILMNLLYPNKPMPIAQEVDKLWHTHLLFTKDYMRFSKKVNNGKFLHHQPTLNIAEQNALKEEYSSNSIEIYKRLFGEPNSNIWAKDSQVCKCCDTGNDDDD